MKSTLLMFAPCERIVIDKDDSSGSLIAIMQGFTLKDPLPSDLRQPVLIPLPWWIFTLWVYQGDSKDEFEQKVELLAADGQSLFSQTTKVETEVGKPFHRVPYKTGGFPVNGSWGNYVLRLSVRDNAEQDFKQIASFPIPVKLADPASS